MLTGKTALITGASRGIGKAIALLMAQNGCDLALVYAHDGDGARQTAFDAGKLGRKVNAYACDAADFKAVKAICEQVIADFGGVDILVNNAGITRDGLVLTMSEADYDAVLNTNLKGAFNFIRHFSGYLIKSKAGRIINITSVSGLTGNAGQANYAASKAGLIGLTKTVAKELAARHVTVNAIAPGLIQTDMTAYLEEGAREKLVASIPLKRVGQPGDVAALALFLASDQASYITGEIIRVDGGMCI